jgi:hypothetical protein
LRRPRGRWWWLRLDLIWGKSAPLPPFGHLAPRPGPRAFSATAFKRTRANGSQACAHPQGEKEQHRRIAACGTHFPSPLVGEGQRREATQGEGAALRGWAGKPPFGHLAPRPGPRAQRDGVQAHASQWLASVRFHPARGEGTTGRSAARSRSDAAFCFWKAVRRACVSLHINRIHTPRACDASARCSNGEKSGNDAGRSANVGASSGTSAPIWGSVAPRGGNVVGESGNDDE